MTLCTTNLLTFCVVFPLIYCLLYNLQHLTNDLQTFFYYMVFYTIKSEILCAISALTLSFMESVTCHLCLTNIFCVTIYTKYSSENLCGIFTHILSFKQFTLWHSTQQIMITFLQDMIYKHFSTWHSTQ